MTMRFSWNRFLSSDQPQSAAKGGNVSPPADTEALRFHQALPGYAPTPLVALPALAGELGLASLHIKDESARFGLGAFKALGASYAVYRFVSRALQQQHGVTLDPAAFLAGGTSALPAMTFCTATDGNHGRAVAWTARQLGQKAVIFVPGNTVSARIEAIRGENAEVVVVDGNYDATVRRAAADAAQYGWQVISDTAYPGYMEIPTWIMQGYTTLFHEADAQLLAAGAPAPDVVLLQAGVGGLLCAGAMHLQSRHQPRPVIVSVEPTDADCLLESIESVDGSPQEALGAQNSIMAGLNCGLPSLVAWPIIRATVAAFLAVDDTWAELAMRRLYAARSGDARVISGESGAAGLAGLMAICTDPALAEVRGRLGLLGRRAHVLLVSTEGATDPAGYARIVPASVARAKGVTA